MDQRPASPRAASDASLPLAASETSTVDNDANDDAHAFGINDSSAAPEDDDLPATLGNASALALLPSGSSTSLPLVDNLYASQTLFAMQAVSTSDDSGLSTASARRVPPEPPASSSSAIVPTPSPATLFAANSSLRGVPVPLGPALFPSSAAIAPPLAASPHDLLFLDGLAQQPRGTPSKPNAPPPPPGSGSLLPLTPPMPAVVPTAMEPPGRAAASAAPVVMPPPPCLDFVSDNEYAGMVESVRAAIDDDAQPMRIGQGSSGSYFCRNVDGQIVGVFKPKDEEPYGDLNPKWTKWLHRNFFFCCFGRSCLIPNVGYLSEAGASLLDDRLGFGLVPRTRVVSLASPAFHYPKRYRHVRRAEQLPLKTGSFQLFLRGFKDASIFLKIHPLPPDPRTASPTASASSSTTSSPARLGASSRPSSSANVDARVPETRIDMTPLASLDASLDGSNGGIAGQQQQPLLMGDSPPAVPPTTGYQGIWDDATYTSFVNQFQRLTILDYLMRNTDRGLDNWMIKYADGRIQVAAIDHGLAFPFKHPDKWRSYPYGWLYMPLAKLPYQPSLAAYTAQLLRDPRWWSRTRTDLRDLFSIDAGFDADAFEAQMAVVRGQIYNLLQCLDAGGSPWDLWFRTPILVVRHPPLPTRRARLDAARAAVARGFRGPAGTGYRPLDAPGAARAAGAYGEDDEDAVHVAGEYFDATDEEDEVGESGSGSDEDDWVEDEDGPSARHLRPRSASATGRRRARARSAGGHVSAPSTPRGRSPVPPVPPIPRGRGAQFHPASSSTTAAAAAAKPTAPMTPPRSGRARSAGGAGDRVRAMWTSGTRKVKNGGITLMSRARNVVLETKRRPWFQNW
ncbi:phosphatidyl inositol kinase [Allomyces javanicus]|nr:phosphatidyl inositol kinase [Allomyces javanicus]